MGRAARLALEYARRPRTGRVKTRLAQTEGPAEALRIYRLLAGDVHAPLLAAPSRGESDVAVYLPAEDLALEQGAPAPEAWLAGSRHRWSQGEGDLGARLSTGFARGLTLATSRSSPWGPTSSAWTRACSSARRPLWRRPMWSWRRPLTEDPV